MPEGLINKPIVFGCHSSNRQLKKIWKFLITRIETSILSSVNISENNHKYIYIYIYIYSHPQTDLFRSIRTHQCGLIVATHSRDRNPVWLKRQAEKLLTIRPRAAISCEVNFKRLWITITIVYIHSFNGCRDLNSNTKRLAMSAIYSNSNIINLFFIAKVVGYFLLAQTVSVLAKDWPEIEYWLFDVWITFLFLPCGNSQTLVTYSTSQDVRGTQ